jgi:hypothetical protein
MNVLGEAGEKSSYSFLFYRLRNPAAWGICRSLGLTNPIFVAATHGNYRKIWLHIPLY